MELLNARKLVEDLADRLGHSRADVRPVDEWHEEIAGGHHSSGEWVESYTAGWYRVVGHALVFSEKIDRDQLPASQLGPFGRPYRAVACVAGVTKSYESDRTGRGRPHVGVAVEAATARREWDARAAALGRCILTDHEAPSPGDPAEVEQTRQALARDFDTLIAQKLRLPG